MDNTYYLDLATLLKTLANISAILTAELPDGVPGYIEPCNGYIRVHNNAIIMSVIMSNGRIIAQGIQALQLLRDNKTWHVSFSTDLLDNTSQQQSALPPPSAQMPSVTPPQLPVNANQRYFPTPVQHSPTTGPLPPQPAPLMDADHRPATGPLPQSGFFSPMEQSYASPSTQDEIPSISTHNLIPGSKIFQQQAELTSQLMGRYNAKERLILRTIYSKVNGQRHVDQLKEELRLPATTVERALRELCHLGVIG